MIVGAEVARYIYAEIKRLKINFTASDRAPDTFELLRRHCSERSIIVWNGASEHTIYGDPKVNHAFRAWHDSLHLILNAPFTLTGEIFVAREQARLAPDPIAKLIIAEVQGQAEYFAEHRVFPADQVKFVLDYIKR